ncbi:MAG TPA: ABC transporter substrate-binding protein [Solirubrobacterales bacterium]|nr:ABC transporter substrate-binding protein [Solirubrobacterales bacterium]
MLALILGLAACGGGGGNGPGSKQLNLVIGNSLPLGGSSEPLGQSGQKASELALDQIRKAAAEAGSDHTVRIVNESQGDSADAAIASAKRLIDEQGASCVTGPWSSEAVARVAHDVVIPAKVLEISPVATGDDVADLNDRDLVDSTALPVSAEGEALAKAIERDLGGIEGFTVNVAASTDPSAATISQDFIQAWQDEKGTVGGQIALPPEPLPSQASQITSNSPDAVLLVDDPTGFAQLAPALSSSSGWDASTAWGNDQLVSPAVPAQVGPNAVEGMRALAPGMPSGGEPTSAFIEQFKSASPRQVEMAPFAAQEFDATILCYLAAVAAGSTDGQEMADHLIDITAPGGTEYSWRQLPGAIKALEDGEDINYTGASGPLDMDVHGDPTNGVFDIYRYASGNLEVVGEVSVEKPNPVAP